MSRLFPPGRIVATPGALEALKASGPALADLLFRHLGGDWGDLGAHDRHRNAQALRHGGRLLSAYTLDDGTRIWIITDADRRSTTVLRPEE